jgi:hypothetical protein
MRAASKPMTHSVQTAVGLAGTFEVVAKVDDAAALAQASLALALPRRWRHVQSVASRAVCVAKALCLPDDLVAAAWLHDIGYGPELVETGFTRWTERATCAASVFTGRW